MRGFFITFEGGDWSGKSTQVEALCEKLRAQGREVVQTREPGGTTLGRRLRTELMHGEEISSKTEALLYAADRAHHVETLIRPALERGATVVCDRYLDSSVAYQGCGRGLGERWIYDLSTWATDALLPDLTFLLDGDPARLRAERCNRELDRIEQAPLEFHVKLRAAFLRAQSEDAQRIVLVDALGAREEISVQVWRHVKRLLDSAQD